MKTIALLILAIIPMQLFAQVQRAEITLDFIMALADVESGRDNLAIGDNGKAFGLLQIHQWVIDDVNAFWGTNYTYHDAFNRKHAIDICRLYLTYWCTTDRLGVIPTLEHYARCWNGGPRGYLKDSTLGYWEKVKGKL